MHSPFKISGVIRGLSLLCLFLPVARSWAGDDPLTKSVVKIFTTMQEPNYYEPWREGEQEYVSGSGCVLPGNRILTNAHVVSNAIFIEVLKEGDSQKYIAKKEFVAHDCDLAILKIDDPKFFQGTTP
jgi:S1-C subfamily serine protease